MTKNDNDLKNIEDDCDDNSSASSGSCFADMGFMFDAAQATKTQTLQFVPTIVYEKQQGKNLDDEEELKHIFQRPISVVIDCVDDNPGAVQSGHYLWPGAPALAQFLVDLFSSSKPILQNPQYKFIFSRLPIFSPEKSFFSIVELGAGCGLAGLTAMQLSLFQNKISSIVFTDHDPGTLDRARENHTNTLEILKASSKSNCDESKNEISANTVPVIFEQLTWGDLEGISRLRTGTSDGFDLILGSDLIYCEEVVKPLLITAAELMSKTKKSSAMIMTQSFSYEYETEEAIDNACNDLSLVRTILSCELETGGVRIQTFHLKEDI